MPRAVSEDKAQHPQGSGPPDTPQTSDQPFPPEKGERPRGQEASPEPALSHKGEALAALLARALELLQPQIEGRGDEPVVTIQPRDIVEVGRICKEDPDLDFKLLHCLSVVDYQDSFQVVCHLYSLSKGQRAVLKADVPYEDPRIPSLVGVWRGADWYEREGHDLFGVVFEGHPNLAPLILYEGFEGYPGRRSFPFHEYQEW